jgi:hypothetical protein
MGDEPAPPAEEEPLNEEPTDEGSGPVTQLPTTGTGPTPTGTSDFLPKALSAMLFFAIAIALHLNATLAAPGPKRTCMGTRTHTH